MNDTRTSVVAPKDLVCYLFAWVLFAVPIMATVIQNINSNLRLIKSLSDAAGDWLTAAAATFVVLFVLYRRRNASVTEDWPNNEHIFEIFAITCAYISVVLLPDRQSSSYWAILLLSTISIVLATTHIFTWSMFEASVGTAMARISAAILSLGFMLAIGGLGVASIARIFGLPYHLIAGATGLVGVLLICIWLPVLVVNATGWRSFRTRN